MQVHKRTRFVPDLEVLANMNVSKDLLTRSAHRVTGPVGIVGLDIAEATIESIFVTWFSKTRWVKRSINLRLDQYLWEHEFK